MCVDRQIVYMLYNNYGTYLCMTDMPQSVVIQASKHCYTTVQGWSKEIADTYD